MVKTLATTSVCYRVHKSQTLHVHARLLSAKGIRSQWNQSSVGSSMESEFSWKFNGIRVQLEVQWNQSSVWGDLGQLGVTMGSW